MVFTKEQILKFNFVSAEKIEWEGIEMIKVCAEYEGRNIDVALNPAQFMEHAFFAFTT